MPFSSGVYTLPNPALVTGEVVSATENNTTRNDLAGALNLTMLRNGTSTATANLPMGGYKLTGLGVATTSGDALSYGQAAVISDFTASGTVTISSGTANGVAYLNGSKVLTTGSALTFDGTNISVIGNQATAIQSILQNNNATTNAGAMLKFKFGSTDTGYLWNYFDGADFITSLQAPKAVVWNIGSAGGTEQMRLTSTGLGIGTSSPAYKLDVNTAGGASATARLYGNDQANVRLRLQNAGTGGNTWELVGGSPGANNSSFAIYDATAAATRLLIDTSGNLGLGVTPSAWGSANKVLQINSAGSLFVQNNAITYLGMNLVAGASSTTYATTNAAALYGIDNSGKHIWYTAPSGTAGNAISFTQAMTLDASGNLSVGITGTLNYSSRLRVLASSNGSAAEFYTPGSNYTSKLNLTNDASGAAVGSVVGNLVFYASDATTERMRIDSSGNLLVGITGVTGSKMQVAADSGNVVYFRNTAGTGIYLVSGNSSWSTVSDERTKTQLTPFDRALEKVVSLRSGTGRYLTDKKSVSRSFLIAQDVQKVLPEAVDTSNPEKLGVQYTDVIPLLVAAIQELKAELDATKAEVAALKGN